MVNPARARVKEQSTGVNPVGHHPRLLVSGQDQSSAKARHHSRTIFALGFTQKWRASRSRTQRAGKPSPCTASTAFLNDTPRVDGTRTKKWRLRPEHAAVCSTQAHADFDCEYDWLIQVDIRRNTQDIPHARAVPP